MHVYISGSISDGGTLSIEERGERIQWFKDAEAGLRLKGYQPINPARHGSDLNKTWLDYMRLALVDLANADGIAFLPGWEASRGARIETTLGRDLGLLVYPLSVWLGDTPP